MNHKLQHDEINARLLLNKLIKFHTGQLIKLRITYQSLIGHFTKGSVPLGKIANSLVGNN